MLRLVYRGPDRAAFGLVAMLESEGYGVKPVTPSDQGGFAAAVPVAQIPMVVTGNGEEGTPTIREVATDFRHRHADLRMDIDLIDAQIV
jgi:hypothetical protein